MDQQTEIKNITLKTIIGFKPDKYDIKKDLIIKFKDSDDVYSFGKLDAEAYKDGMAVAYGSGDATTHGYESDIIEEDTFRRESNIFADSQSAITYGIGSATAFKKGNAICYKNGSAFVYGSGQARTDGNGHAYNFGYGRAEANGNGDATTYKTGNAITHGLGNAASHGEGSAIAYANGNTYNVHGGAAICLGGGEAHGVGLNSNAFGLIKSQCRVDGTGICRVIDHEKILFDYSNEKSTPTSNYITVKRMGDIDYFFYVNQYKDEYELCITDYVQKELANPFYKRYI